MPRVRLAYWHGKHAPGDEIDVDGEQLRHLQRDGRIAEVVEPAPPAEPAEAAPSVEPAPGDERRRKAR